MQNNFRELLVWKKSIEFTKNIYRLTKEFPKSEIYGLSSQMQRAAVSIPSNIAEGSGRESKQEFAHFLNIAIGSSYEVETQLILANSCEYLNDIVSKDMLDSIHEIQKMLGGLKNKITSK